MLPLALAIALAADPIPVVRSADELFAAVQTDGHPTLVHFWATWCKTCVDELPEIRRLESRLVGSQVHLMFVSLDPTSKATAVGAYLKQKALMPNPGARAVLLDAPDPEKVTARFDPKWSAQLPATFLVVSSGATVAAFLGPTPVDAVLETIRERFGPQGSKTGSETPDPSRR